MSSSARRIAFSVRLRVPVGEVRERGGWLLEGPAGWGELSPLPGWGARERQAAARSAEEARLHPFPTPLREVVTVNAMVPRVPPDHAAALASRCGCGTVKVKVGDAAGLDRVRAVREAVGRHVRLRVDANGSWDLDAARRELRLLAPLEIELAEDPVASLEELARLRRASPIPIAAEASIRSLDDARRLRHREAADAVVLKPQRLGGIRPALRIADAAGVPAIASSALESSVGLAAVLALAAALPDTPYAHGIGTAQLLDADVTAEPLLPVRGLLALRRIEPSAELLATAETTGGRHAVAPSPRG